VTAFSRAKFLACNATMGVIDIGRNADMVLLDGNTVESIHNRRRVAGVVRARFYYSFDDPFSLEQPDAWLGRGRGVGENEADGPVDQYIARADCPRASFDQWVEEQAGRRRHDRYIRPRAASPSHPFERWTTYSQRRTSAM